MSTVAASIETHIEDTWRELIALPCGRTRQVWMTRAGRVYASSREPRSVHTREVGTYGRSVSLADLREDVFWTWDQWRA